MSLTVLALDPRLSGVAWLRDYVCHELGGDLMMADSVAAMEAAIDARTPDLLVIGPGTPPRVETEARAILRSDRATAATEVVRLCRAAPESSRKRSALGRWLDRSSQPPDEAEGMRVAKRRIEVTVERIRTARERRLQEELAARLRNSVIASTAPPAIAVRTTAPALAGTPERASARPYSTRVTPGAHGPTTEPIGIQNEWGFFDPERCGADALAAALDRAPSDPRDGLVERSPADLLLEFDTAAPPWTAPKVPLAAPGSGSDGSRHAVSAGAYSCSVPMVARPPETTDTGLDEDAVAAESVAFEAAPPDVASSEAAGATRETAPATATRPFPLALWAHLADCCHAVQHPGTPRRWSEGFAGLATTLALGLQLASSTGPAGSATGCRIHRIRVVDAGAPSTMPATPWAGVAAFGGAEQ